MVPLIAPFLLGIGAGMIGSKILSTEDKTEKEFNDFYIFVRGEGNEKFDLIFYDYESAKKLFDKIIETRKIRYSTILEYDKRESELYSEWINKGWGKEEGFRAKSSKINVIEVVFGKGNDQFESKTF